MQRDHPELNADWRSGDTVRVKPHKRNDAERTLVFENCDGCLDLSKPPIRGRYLVWWSLLGTLRINVNRITNISAQERAAKEKQNGS